jgi:hypothetical protein
MNLGVACSDQGEAGNQAPAIQVGMRTMTRAIAVLSGSTAYLPRPIANIGHAIAALWREITRDAVRPYRPEQHYMRGPGPAWRAKHGDRMAG